MFLPLNKILSPPLLVCYARRAEFVLGGQNIFCDFGRDSSPEEYLSAPPSPKNGFAPDENNLGHASVSEFVFIFCV